MITIDIKQRRGSKKNIEFEAKGSLAGHELSFVVKRSTEVTDMRVIDKNILRTGEMSMSFNPETDITKIIISLLEEDTYELPAGNYYYDLDDLTLSDTLANGIFILIADVQTPFDNLESLPLNNLRMIIANPAEFEDNTFIYKITEEAKEKFTGITINNAKEILGITSLENSKVDKIEGKGLSENDLTGIMKNNYNLAYEHSLSTENPHDVTKGQIGLGNVQNADTTNPENIIQNQDYRFTADSEKANWNSAYSEKHTHSNKSNLDSVNQNLGTGSTVQFSQAGFGRSVFSSWSILLQTGMSTRSGTYIDWEGGNARIRENGYNFEFSNYDGSTLSVTLKLSASGNISYKPLITNGQSYKVISVSANTTLTASDHVVIVTTSSTDKTITLPITNIPDGTVFCVKKADSGSGKVIVQGASGTIDGQGTIEWNTQYSAYQFMKNGSNYSILCNYL